MEVSLGCRCLKISEGWQEMFVRKIGSWEWWWKPGTKSLILTCLCLASETHPSIHPPFIPIWPTRWAPHVPPPPHLSSPPRPCCFLAGTLMEDSDLIWSDPRLPPRAGPPGDARLRCVPVRDPLWPQSLRDPEHVGVWEISEKVIQVIVGYLWLLWAPETMFFLVDGCK